MLILPRVKKGLRGAAVSLRRTRLLIGAVAVGVALLRAPPARGACLPPQSRDDTADAIATDRLGALLLALPDELHVIGGHRSHSSHRSHASHASGYSPPAPRPRTPEPQTEPEPVKPNKARSGSADSVADELRKLAELRNAGVISQEEFEKLKKDLLARKR